MEKPASLWQKFRSRPLLFNLVLIVAALVVLGVAAHLVLLGLTRHGARRTVPDLTGISLDDARRLADRNDLELYVNDSLYVPMYDGGVVLDQLPGQGVEVKPGRTVYITINSFRQRMVPVPYVAGRSLRQAKNMLETASLEIERLVYRPDMATNYVLEQRSEGREVSQGSRLTAEAGSGIVLYVGVEPGSELTVVPQIVGASLREAKSRLWENGLNVGAVRFDEGIDLLTEKDARVYEQGPAQGRSVALGTAVDLKLTLDAELVGRNSAAAEKEARALAEERLRQEAAAADSLARVQFEQAMHGGEPTDEEGAATDEPAAEEEFFD